jgi:hypothetical protein
MCWGRRLAPVLAAATLLAGALAPAALADGDPASDYLIGQPVYVPPTDKNVPLSDAGLLDLLVADAKRGGFTIKVALIGTPTDLGSVTSLWRRPQRYAQFLSEELFYVYKQPLLIVMPNGFGFWNYGRPASRERQVLRSVTIPGGASGLSQAASAGVAALAGAAGHPIKVPSLQSGGGFPDRIVIAAVGAALLVLMAALTIVWRRRRPRGHSHPQPDEG